MYRIITFIIIIPVLLGPVTSCKEKINPSPIEISHSTFLDSRDQITYKSLTIGTQSWMAENLAYIPYVSGGVTQSGIWVYNYEGTNVDSAKASGNYQTFGCLYDWETAKEVCPIGWHLPSDEEWNELAKFVRDNGYEYSEADALKSSSIWISGNGVDAYGFNALPAGSRGLDGSFYYLGGMTTFWSSTYGDENYAWVYRLDHTRSSIVRHESKKLLGFSVRCIKD